MKFGAARPRPAGPTAIEDVTAASSGNGVSEKDINGFYELMDKDHRQGKARDDLRKGKYTT
jgi:hypothetical protein